MTTENPGPAIGYYKRILERGGPGFIFPVKQLIGYRSQASKKVQSLALNEAELTAFLSRFPRIFQLRNGNVQLSYNRLTYHNTKRAVEYYSDVIKRFSSSSAMTINSLFGHRGQASPDVLPVAKNALELRKFLLKHPEAFKVEKDCVYLPNPVGLKEEVKDINRLSSLTINDRVSKPCSPTVEYYSNVLKKIGPNKKVPIAQIINWYQAPCDVEDVTKIEADLLIFFTNYPEIFIVTEDKFVMLKSICLETPTILTKSPSFKNSKKKGPQQTSFTDKGESKKKGPQQTSFTDKGESNSESAVKFYYSVLNKIGPKHLYQIQRLVGHRGYATPDVKNVAKNELELTIFLKKHPSVFIVEEDCVRINITKEMNQTDMSCNVLQPDENSLNSNAAVDYYREILDKYSPNCEFPLDILIKYRAQATPVVQEIARNITELHAFLSKHPNIFTLKEGKVLLSVLSHNMEEAIIYYQKVLLKTDERKLSLPALLEYRGKAPPDVKYVVKNEIQLEKLLSTKPSIFIVLSGYVYLKPYYKTIDE